MARGRHGNAGQPLAQHQPQGLGQRCIALVVDLGEIGPEQPVFEHFVDIAGHARHAHAAQGLDTRLFERVEGGPRLRVHRRPLPMGFRIVAGEPHGHGVALPAGNGDVAPGRQPRQVGEPGLVRGQERPIGGEAHLELRRAADGPHGRAHGRFEDLGLVGLVGLAARWVCHESCPGRPLTPTLCPEGRGGSSASGRPPRSLRPHGEKVARRAG